MSGPPHGGRRHPRTKESLGYLYEAIAEEGRDTADEGKLGGGKQCPWLQVPAVQCVSWKWVRDRVGRVGADGGGGRKSGLSRGNSVCAAGIMLFAVVEIKLLVCQRMEATVGVGRGDGPRVSVCQACQSRPPSPASPNRDGAITGYLTDWLIPWPGEPPCLPPPRGDPKPGTRDHASPARALSPPRRGSAPGSQVSSLEFRFGGSATREVRRASVSLLALLC